jgi:(S)-3,5-dihydroxyphenylglycine transaminase
MTPDAPESFTVRPVVTREPVTPITVELKPCFADETLDGMNLLNEIVDRYPQAISFAPGRPPDSLLDVRRHIATLPRFIAALARRSGTTAVREWRRLGQYSRTNGVIQEAIALHLRLDEGIDVSPEAIITTVGAQEAMAILLTGLFDPQTDILLASDPTYVGITGLARILDIHVVSVPADDAGLDPDAVERTLRSIRGKGRVRALYDIPDFNNPLGSSLSMDRRVGLLDVCRRHGLLLIEDNPYGMFCYDGNRLPTLKAMDRDGTVIYIGSFAKTLFPSLRVGYLVADQRVGNCESPLARALSRVKSLITVNTSALCQAIVANAIESGRGSLDGIVAPKRDLIRRNRDTLVATLDKSFADLRGAVHWTVPHGGFFLAADLPFDFGAAELRACAQTYGVIACPMRLFTLAGGSRLRQIRLSFSYLTPPEIETGVARLSRYVRDRLRR